MNGYEIFLVTAVLCGVISAWIAKEKGRSPVLWFFIGAALNVVILGILYLRAPRRNGTSTSRP